MRPEWKDETSYRRDDKERVPSVWTIRLSNDLRITVVRKHLYSPDSWVMHCEPWFKTFSLNLEPTAENTDEAMARALSKVRAKVEELSTIMRGMN